MSEIPYYFKMPVPLYFYDGGWFKSQNTFKFVTWAFSKCQNIIHKEIHDGKEIILDPYEFIAGRNSSAESCFLTPDEFRTQLITQLKAGNLKKSPNSVPNRFTCYKWVTERFSKSSPQLKPQQVPNSSPTNPHKRRTKKEDDIDIEDDRLERQESPFIKKTYSFNASIDEMMQWLHEYTFPNPFNEKITEKCLIRWFSLYDVIEIVKSVKYAEKMHKKKPKDNLEAYIELTLKKQFWKTDELRELAKGREKEHKKQKEERYGD